MRGQESMRPPECVVVECGSGRQGANLSISYGTEDGLCLDDVIAKRWEAQNTCFFAGRASNSQWSGDSGVLFALKGRRTVCAWTMSSPASQTLSMGVCLQEEPQVLSTIVIGIVV